MQALSPQEAHERLEAGGVAAVLVDVRTPPEFARSRVPGSRNIPLDELPEHLDELKKFKEQFFICRSGARSGAACQFLSQLPEFTNAYNIEGGLIAWASSGLPISKA